MISIHKKMIIDEHGKPVEVIIPWVEFKEMEEILGLDFDQVAIDDLKQAQKDREAGNREAYLDFESI